MMDGRVGAIREELDGDGFAETPILAYSAKFASAFYGPFREAADSAPAFGDRRGYQMDPANGREAVREALLDVQEGADMVMVKPALAYGDLISAVKRATRLPVAAYNVSGEYAMVKAAAAAGYLDERATVLEILTSLHRAGADTIITYHAKDVARWLRADMSTEPRDAVVAPLADVADPTLASTAPPKIRSRKDGAAIALDELDRRLLNLMQGSFPIAPRPYRHVAEQAGVPGARSCSAYSACSTSASSARSRRSLTRARSGYSSMLVAAKVDPEHPHRAAQVINQHPGVSHNYLRNHEFNLWFTIATEPDSKLGSRERWRCSRARQAPSRCASCRRCACSRSAWTSRWRAAPTRCQAPPRSRSRSSSSPSPTTSSTSR